MTAAAGPADTVRALDAPTRELVRLAATIAAGTEPALREGMTRAVSVALEPAWVEELVLQSYLFAGFPRALNAEREWRRASGRRAPVADEGEDFGRSAEWAARGAETCAVVYGPMYARLRANIRDLHPALDAWMIVEGYGKVLSRPGLDLTRRELCIVAVCAVLAQDRQLHSHLYGAVHAGASDGEVEETLEAVAAMVPGDSAARYRQLWARVRDR